MMSILSQICIPEITLTWLCCSIFPGFWSWLANVVWASASVSLGPKSCITLVSLLQQPHQGGAGFLSPVLEPARLDLHFSGAGGWGLSCWGCPWSFSSDPWSCHWPQRACRYPAFLFLRVHLLHLFCLILSPGNVNF